MQRFENTQAGAKRQARLFKLLFTRSLVKTYSTGSGKNRRTEESLVWQKEGVAKLKQVLANDANSELHFRFKVPENLPESDAGLSSNRHIWRVTIENKELGLNRSFEIPVYAVTNQVAINTSQHRYGRKEYSSISDNPETSIGPDKKHKNKTDIRKYLPFLDSQENQNGIASTPTI